LCGTDAATISEAFVKLIGLEEHFVTAEVLKAWQELEPEWQDLSLTPSTHGDSARRLADLETERLADMDRTGLDVQVLSLSTPGVQNLDPADAVALQTTTNDIVADATRARLHGVRPDPLPHRRHGTDRRLSLTASA